MDELGPDEQRWLDALRAADEPSAADRARVRAAVVAGIAAGGTAAALGTSGAVAKAAAKAGFFAVAWKIGIAAVVVAAAGGAGYVAVRGSRPPPVVSAKVDAPARSTPGDNAAAASVPAPPPAANASGAPAEIASGPSAVAVAATEPSSVRRAPPRAPASSRGADDLDGELALLTQAQRALEHGDPTAALAALAQDRKEHPQGALAVEREGLRAIASCDAKRSDGRALAERFVAKNPSSPLVARVKTACLSP